MKKLKRILNNFFVSKPNHPENPNELYLVTKMWFNPRTERKVVEYDTNQVYKGKK